MIYKNASMHIGVQHSLLSIFFLYKIRYLLQEVSGNEPKQNKANLRDLIAAIRLVISNWIKIVDFSGRVTLKFERWPKK